MSKILELTVLALLVVLPATAFQNPRRSRSGRNRAPIIQSFVSSNSVVSLCPFVPSGACSPTGTRVELAVTANDPDNDALTYSYSVSKGAIVGSGQAVAWDLRGAYGKQTAVVEVSDRRGGKASSVARVDVVECGACDPPCPVVNVTCSTNVTEGEIAIFEATVNGGDLTEKIIYLWSHSGERIAGEEDWKLRIKAKGLPGDVITATVRVLGFHPACSYQASCESTIVKRP